MQEAVHLCAVLEPLRLATKLLEGDEKSPASVYLPLFFQTSETLKKRRGGHLPLPKELRDQHGPSVPMSNLVPLADKLREFLAKDIQAIRAKHLTGTTGDELLAACTFLDLRFQRHEIWKSYLSKDAVQKSVAHMALEASSQYPELLARLHKQSEDPMNWSLFAFAESAAPKAKAGRRPGGRARGRGRAGAAAKNASAKPEARSKAEAVLRTVSAPSGQHVKRRLRQQTSAESWLFGGAEVPEETEQAVLKDVEAVPRHELYSLLLCFFSGAIISE